ncbi:MAG: 5-oxoprolinase subunit PxpA [Arenicellales bacterium]|nr:5-oxoprolinase subunit PxpA [Arenicellales bacterium]
MKLNCDLGEGAGIEQAVMPFIDQASIACGVHAGDLDLIGQTMALAQQHGVSIGAHPGYPDREHFGRVSMNLSPEEINTLVAQQLEGITQMGAVDYVKPHGALYHDMMRDKKVLSAIQLAIGGRKLMVQALPGGKNEGEGVIFEAFADRRYVDSGELLSRNEERSLLSEDETLEQVRLLVEEGIVRTISGKRLELQAQSLCVHGDNPAGVGVVPLIRKILDND